MQTMKKFGIAVWMFTFNIVCTYAQTVDGPYTDAYLEDFACSPSHYFSLEAATAACISCATCAGIVEMGGLYRTRGDDLLRPSPAGETAWLVDAAPTSCGFGTVLQGKYLSTYACDETNPFYDITSAKRACCGCDTCGGVTCNQAGECTIREGTVDQTSPYGESSYLLDEGNTCLHLSGTLAEGPYTVGQAPNGTGTIDLVIAPDLESFTISIEYSNLIGDVLGIHLHDAVTFFQVAFVCLDDMRSPCTRTYKRGDLEVTTSQSFDTTIDGLLHKTGFSVLVHTTYLPFSEIYGYLYCNGIPAPHYEPACHVPRTCASELIACGLDSQCTAWEQLYSLGACHFSGASITPAQTCWSLLNFDINSPGLALASAFHDCIICCGPCP